MLEWPTVWNEPGLRRESSLSGEATLPVWSDTSPNRLRMLPYFPHTFHTSPILSILLYTSPNRLMLVDAVLISIWGCSVNFNCQAAQLTVNWLMPHARHSFPTTWQSGSSRQICSQLHFMHSPFSNSLLSFHFFPFLFMIKSKMTQLTAKTDSLQFLIN